MLADAQGRCYVHQHMRIHKPRSNSHACGEQVASKATTGPQYQQIKLALDVHAASIVVGRMIDGAKAAQVLPKGMGRLTCEAVETEAPTPSCRLLIPL